MNIGYKHIEEFLLNTFILYEAQIKKSLLQFDVIKSISYFSAEFERSFQNDENSDPLLEKRTVHIPSKMLEIYSNTDLEKHFQTNVIDFVIEKVDEVMIEGSGFTLSKIIQLSTQFFKYEPLKASGFIELPKILKWKRAIVNLKNTYDECFK